MIRRVVTEVVDGRSKVRSDDMAADLWVTSNTDRFGIDPTGPERETDGSMTLDVPPGGTRFRIVSLPPDAQMRAALAAGNVAGIDADGFHQTATVDYVFILDGDVTLELDDEDMSCATAGNGSTRTIKTIARRNIPALPICQASHSGNDGKREWQRSCG